MISFPCEIVGRKVLPAIRRNVVKFLIEKKKFSRREVAKSLGITEAAVCYYMNSKRGQSFRFSKKAKKEIDNIAEKISAKPRMAKKILDEGFCCVCGAVKKDKKNKMLSRCRC